MARSQELCDLVRMALGGRQVRSIYYVRKYTAFSVGGGTGSLRVPILRRINGVIVVEIFRLASVKIKPQRV